MYYDSHTFLLNIVRLQSLSTRMTVAQDVTESTKNERSVAAMADELRQFVDKANAPIFGIDVNGNVNEWNNLLVNVSIYLLLYSSNFVSTALNHQLRQISPGSQANGRLQRHCRG